MTDAWERDGRVDTGFQQGWCEHSSVHEKLEYQSTERSRKGAVSL